MKAKKLVVVIKTNLPVILRVSNDKKLLRKT